MSRLTIDWALNGGHKRRPGKVKRVKRVCPFRGPPGNRITCPLLSLGTVTFSEFAARARRRGPPRASDECLRISGRFTEERDRLTDGDTKTENGETERGIFVVVAETREEIEMWVGAEEKYSSPNES